MNKGNKNKKLVKYKLLDMYKDILPMLKMLLSYKAILSVAIISSVASTIIWFFVPKLFAKVIDIFFYGFVNSSNFFGEILNEEIIGLLITLACVYLLIFGLHIATNFINNFVANRVKSNFRILFVNKIFQLPSSYFENTKRGDLISRMANDVEQIGNGITTIFENIITKLISIIGSVMLMFTLNVPLSVFAIIIVPIQILLSLMIVKNSQKYYNERQTSLGNLNSIVEESINGLNVVRSYNKQDYTIQKFDKANASLLNESFRAKIISSFNGPANNLLSKIYYVIVVMFGAYFCVLNIMTVGNVQAFIQYLSSFNGKANSFVSFFDSIQKLSASCKRLKDFIDIKGIESNDKNSYEKLDNNVNEDGSIIKFENIKFSYDNKKTVINDFNLSIKNGETIAIVGPTGAGKSTLIKLLLRFYDNYEGQIKLYGKDIKSLDYDNVRSKFAVVLQNLWFYNSNVLNNIKFGKLDASDEEAIEASRLAHADNAISKLEYKYDTIMSGTENMSHGQKQLIAIARAILPNKDIIVLDEATNFVDTNTEQQLYKVFDKLIKEKTSIVIAHRLSTIKNADKIVVVNNGQIEEVGNHDELVSKKGFYYDLYKSGKYKL